MISLEKRSHFSVHFIHYHKTFGDIISELLFYQVYGDVADEFNLSCQHTGKAYILAIFLLHTYFLHVTTSVFSEQHLPLEKCYF